MTTRPGHATGRTQARRGGGRCGAGGALGSCEDSHSGESPAELRETENEVERLRTQKEDAIRTQAFEAAARLRDAERKLRAELDARKQEWKEQQTKTRTVVSEEDIAYVVSKWTGIPLQQLEEAESAKLLRMESELGRRVVGQEEAIRAVSA